MRVWAVIPVKSLYRSKQRLARVLSTKERMQLVRRLLQRLLSELQQLPEIEQVLVVTSDAEVAGLAGDAGALVLAESTPPDLNAAVTQGVRYAARQGAEGALILPTDLPFVSADAVALILRAGSSGRNASTNGTTVNGACHLEGQPLLLICPDEAQDGTNAIFMTPVVDYAFHYGPASFQQHLAEAALRGYAVQVLTISALAFDLDTEDDWFSYQLTKV